ncbi:zinc finger protein 579 [Emydura macquarii macquarii]|uniref:zinc finger protein 579 n=1 Tax=Emydura macquarii macquarii TaxID=1129001 RepID=UPI00352BBE51
METELAESPPSTPPALGLPPDSLQAEPPPELPGRPRHQQPHQCSLCRRRFAQAHGLRQHRCRPRGLPAQSPAGGESCSAEAAPGSHRCRSVAKRGHPCQVCGKQFKFPYYLARHGLTHNGQKPFQCPVCRKTFRRPAHLARHQRTHARQRRAACPRRPPEPDERLRQQAGQPGEGRADEKQVLLQEDWTLLCLACQEAFETKGELKAHKCFKARGRAGPDGTKRHQCSVCHKFFARPWSLSRHHLVHTGEKPFTCPDCGMTFRLSSYLKQHSRSHGAGGLPFGCPLCRQRFHTPAELALHQRAHEGDALPASSGGAEQPGAGAAPVSRKGYACSVCGKTFKSKYDLATHFLIHTGELPYQCGQCGKRFRRLSHLKQHHVTHTGARPFQCVLCQKEFKRLADLARHRQVHEGDKPHQCGVCHKFFSRAYSLLRHQRGHQPGLLAGARPEAFLSNSCFDSQDHSAFCTPEEEEEEEEEEEWGAPGGSGQGS